MAGAIFAKGFCSIISCIGCAAKFCFAFIASPLPPTGVQKEQNKRHETNR